MKIIDYLKHPSKIILKLDNLRIITLNDKKYIEMLYKLHLGKKLDLNNPRSFNEKLQWLKLNDRKNMYTIMVDKYSAKEYISNIIGSNYVIPTLGIYDKFDDIDFSKLPNQFVIKCTHDSGGLVIVKNKATLNIRAAKKKIEKSLKNNYYYSGREWPYKNVKPRIIIEEYMEDNKTKDLKDYKFFVFEGKIECIQVDYDRFINHKRAFYDNNWKRLPFTTCYPTDYSVEIERPKKLDEMKEIVKKIATSIGNVPYVRIDLYAINNKIYFGEITFYHGSGLEKFYPEDWDYKLGNLIKISNRRGVKNDKI